MKEKVKTIIENEINPMLAQHGGGCELVDVGENGVVTINFLGGCSGCPSRNMTLLSGVAPMLKEKVPEITEVVLA